MELWTNRLKRKYTINQTINWEPQRHEYPFARQESKARRRELSRALPLFEICTSQNGISSQIPVIETPFLPPGAVSIESLVGIGSILSFELEPC